MTDHVVKTKLNIRNTENFTLLLIMIATIIIISIFLPQKFLTLINFQSMSSQFPEYGLLSLGIMLAMITGGIDLSIVSIANLSGVMAALVLVAHSHPSAAGVSAGVIILLAILTSVVTGIFCGILNGILVSLAGVPAIIATLGTNGLFMGIAIIITGGTGIQGFPEEFLFFGSGTFLKLPIPLVIYIIVAVIIHILLTRTKQGFNMYMVGSSSVVSKFSGIRNNRVLMVTYMLSGLLAGIAAIIMISRVNSMRPGYGYAYLLLGVLIAILGGTDSSGGRGNVLGLSMAIIILQVLQSGLNILGFSPFFKKFIWGLILIFVMVINFIRTRKDIKRT